MQLWIQSTILAAMFLLGVTGIARAQPVEVPVHLEPPLNHGPVFLAGTFNGWSSNDSAFELTDPDNDGEWSAIVSMDTGIHHFRYVQGDIQTNWIRDPRVPEADSPWGNSEFDVTDPMIVYLLPLDGGTGLRPGEPIRAVFGFSNAYPIDPATLVVTINGQQLANPQDYYDAANQEFRYVPPVLLEPGSYTVSVSAMSDLGLVTRSTSFERAPAIELQTQDITYRKSDIVAYGRINDPAVQDIEATLNGTPVASQFVGGLFTSEIELLDGENTFAVTATDGFGNAVVETQILTAALDLRPTIEIDALISGNEVQVTAIGSAHDNGTITFEWFAEAGNPSNIVFSSPHSGGSDFDLPAIDGEYQFGVIASDAAANTEIARRILWIEKGAPRLNEINDHAEWIEEMIVYELMPELAMQYGNLQDATAHLPSIADLGANTVLVTPIFATDHDCTLGYDITNYYDVCIASGDSFQDIKDFVDTGHALGLRMLLDLPLSHTGYRHPFMQNVLALADQSPFADYYLWEGIPGESDYLNEYNWWHRPWINLNNSEARDYVIDVAEYWIREIGFDGYRLDVANQIHQRSPEFWPEFRRRLKNFRPDIYLLSEGVPPGDHWYDARMDSNFDFDLRGWGFEDENALIRLLDGAATIDDVHNVLSREWPSHARPVRFVEHHDQHRIPYDYDLARSMLTHALISTVPGIPYFFSGGEVGHTSRRWDVDTPVPWHDPYAVRPYFKTLIGARKQYIRNGATLARLTNSAPSTVYSYLTESETGRVVTILNFSDTMVDGSFDGTIIADSGNSFYRLRDLLVDDESVVFSSDVSDIAFSLPAYGVHIVAVEPDGCSAEFRHACMPVVLPDLNGNGSPDVGVAVPGSTRVHVRDGSSSELLSDVNFGNDTSYDMIVVPDLDGSGDPEIAVLQERDTGVTRVLIKDSLTGDTTGNAFFGDQYQAIGMAVIDDFSGNGLPELAVLGQQAGSDRIRVMIRDAATDAGIRSVFLGNRMIAKHLVAIPDVTGNGEMEIATMGIVKTSNQIMAPVRDVEDSTLHQTVFWANQYEPVKTSMMADINGGGSPELVALGRDPGSGAGRLQIRDVSTRTPITTVFLGSTSEVIDLALLADTNANGFADVAILSRTATDNGLVRVYDSATGALLKNVFYNSLDAPVGLAVLPDFSSNGFEELAVLGENGGMQQVQIKDAVTGAFVSTIDYP